MLPQLFADIYVPQEVIAELGHSGAPELVKAWAASLPHWLNVAAPTKLIPTSVRLDVGELHAIPLAAELRASLVLIDERKGRRAASEFGVKAIGTLSVLELAAERRLLELEPSLQALRQTTFYISDEYLEAALQRDIARIRT